jgi:hypothetical protein
VKYDQLGQLFVPMLASAQNANDVIGVRAGGSDAALRAASLFAGELIRDNNFTPVRPGSVNSSNAYAIDFNENSFQVETSVSARDAHRVSLFRVKVTGAIRGDKFLVSDHVSRSTLFSFTRFEANKHDFFFTEFPLRALDARQNPSTVAGDTSAMTRGVIDMVLGIPVGAETITVRLHKQSDSITAEVKNPVTNKVVMTLPVASLGNITQLVETIAQHLSSNALDHISLRAH